jgi:ATP-dependent Clp protease ATP-binding subunit ClpA
MATPENPVDHIFQPGGRLRGDLLTDTAAGALRESLRLARDTRWDSVRSPHIFMGLLAVPDAGVHNWGERLGADLTQLLEQFQELFSQESGDSEPLLVLNREFLSDNVIRLLRDAYQRAQEQQRNRISPMDLLISLFTSNNSIVADCFAKVGFTPARLTELAVMAEQHARAN